MPAEIYGEKYEFLARPQLLSFEEIERLARIFVGLGVEKLRITGGEPLLRHDLPRLIARLARIEGVRDLTLTTNGFLLAAQARALADAGLRRITVSLDSHDDETFGRMNGRGHGTARVLGGIEAAAAVGLAPIKINCVVQRGVNEHSIVPLARRFRGSGHVMRFIEYMDVGTLNGWDPAQVVSAAEIVRTIDAGEEGGRASGFPAVGILLGVDLGKRLSAALFLQGANLETSSDYGAFDLFAAGGDLKLNLLGYDDRNGIERLYVYVHARGGVAKTSPEGLFGADEVIAAVGPGLEYYTQLRHFSIALGADAVYASEAGAFGFAVYPTLRYTF